MSSSLTTPPVPAPGRELSVRSALRSEMIKFRSLRPLVWLTVAGGAVQATLGPVQVLGLVVEGEGTSSVASLDQAMSLALTGMGTACVLFGILGVLTVTSEYSSRTIRSTLTAVPRRGYVVTAKLLTYVMVAGVVAALSSFGALAAALPSFSTLGLQVDPVDGDVVRVVLGAAFYLLMWGCYGQLLGWLLRSTVGATMTLLALFFVLPALVALLPQGLAEAVLPYLPTQTPSSMVSPGDAASLPAGTGVALSVLYVGLGMAGVTRRLSRRDA